MRRHTSTFGLLAALALAAGCSPDSATAPPAIRPFASVTATTAAVQPALPRTHVVSRYVAPTGRVLRVPAGGDFQAALNRAQPGDVIELAAGATYRGNFLLKPKGGTRYITIRGSAWQSLPPERTRVGPANATLMPKIVSPNAMPALRTSGNASYYRIMGVEATFAPSVTYGYSIVALNNSRASRIAGYPHHIIIDRSYVHGNGRVSFQRCVTLNAAYAAVIDSYLSACHGKPYDSQAIVAWNTPGPLKIVGNYLEGAGENVMIGGAPPSISGLVPSDIVIRGNHFYKPLSWEHGVWLVKNLLETKNARRMLVEGNVFENNWADGQNGVAILLKSSKDSGLSFLEDVTFRYNLVKNSPNGITILGHRQGQTPTSANVNSRILVAHNILENVGDATMPNGGSFWVFMSYDGGNDITIDHNTVVSGRTSSLMVFSAHGPGTRFRFTNNIATRGRYGVHGDGSMRVPAPAEGTKALATYYPGYVFQGNVIGLDGGNPANYPAGNYWPSTREAIGLTGYALSAGSRYAGMATDGTNPGANIQAVTSRIAEVR